MKRMRNLLRPPLSVIAACTATACLLGPLPALTQDRTPLVDPIPGVVPPSPEKIALRPIVLGLVSPVAAAVAPGDHDNIYVVDQVGQAWRVWVRGKYWRPRPTLFLDVKNLLVPLGIPPSNFDERGFLGLAFHPDFDNNGKFYTYTSQPANRPPDFSTQPPGVVPDCQSVITEWRVRTPGFPYSRVDRGSARELLRIDKPHASHNGGALAFGPDGMLYIALGDGGQANDQGAGHAPEGNGQNLAPNNVLGKILRIDPQGTNSANGKYGIPADNPMVGKEGADEIFAYGFRNPFRMSFDASGQLWVADVGQASIEEINIAVAGGNYGWRIKEGSFLFNAVTENTPGFVYAPSPGLPAGLVDPIAEYDHADGPGLPAIRSAVIGGFVYRGNDIEGLRGRYVFGDYTGSGSPTPAGHLLTLGAHNEVLELVATNRNPLNLAVLGFGQDYHGELYLLANGTGTLNGNTGVVLKIAKPRRFGD